MYREIMSMTVEAVAAQLRTTPRTVLRWEAGHANLRARDLETLADMYCVPDRDRAELEALARESRIPGWWAPFTRDISPTYATFLGLEAEAEALQDYSSILIPGLLQTERYMRTVMQAAYPVLDEETIDTRIELRRKRQAETFGRDHRIHLIIDESCLWRSVGGFEIMREQLDAVREAAKSRRVTLQVLPMRAGFAAMVGSFCVLTFPSPDDPPVACVEMRNGCLHVDPREALIYAEYFDKLREASLPERLALELVQEITKEVHHAH
jgi:transcriptional regulator with XRE-family HTH domain